MPAAHPAGADNQFRGSGDAYLTERQFCERYRVSARTAQRWRVTGDGPPFVRLGPHKIVYRLSDAETWALAERSRIALMSCHGPSPSEGSCAVRDRPILAGSRPNARAP